MHSLKLLSCAAMLFAFAPACADSNGGADAAPDGTEQSDATAAGDDFEAVRVDGRARVTLRNDVARTIFDALAASLPTTVEGAATAVSGAGVTCRSEAGAATCVVDAFDAIDAGLTPTGAAHGFYDFSIDSAPVTIGTALSKMPGVEVLNDGTLFRVGRLSCLVLRPAATGAAHACSIAVSAP